MPMNPLKGWDRGELVNWRPERVNKSPAWIYWYINNIHSPGVTNPVAHTKMNE